MSNWTTLWRDDFIINLGLTKEDADSLIRSIKFLIKQERIEERKDICKEIMKKGKFKLSKKK